MPRSYRDLVRLTATGVVLGLVMASCASPGEPEGGGPVTIEVPGRAATIGDALAAARPGDTVLVSPGVYRESVQVDKAGVTVRGTDRNSVVIDGEGLRSNGIVVTADRVVVENLTVRGHNLNGVLVTGMRDDSGGLARGSDGYHRLDPAKFPPVKGFAVRYVTAANNGLYGVYAFDAFDGVIEQSYASGHADSGFYVGQCKPCRIVVRDNVGEFNAVGYEQANASQEVYVVRNRFSHNRVGLTILSDYQEAFVPQQDAVIAGNLVTANSEPKTPAQADGAFGVGIGVAGGQRNQVRNNRVTAHPAAGIAIGSSEDIAPIRNRLTGNVAEGNALDLAYTATKRAPGVGNCLETAGSWRTLPAGLVSQWRCSAGTAAVARAGVRMPPVVEPAGISFRAVGTPPRQPGMPEGELGRPAAQTPDWLRLPVPAATLFAERVRAR
ncbi:right-handed parallel beta-helix repeat-containing protein [Kribbella deserti]|uniref:Right-handed parallel beta-helix repeat-containing protein n=1 Tax=Kribbella deserti TaxID=1926257 RepID=A0ABV6QX19_9ACTN